MVKGFRQTALPHDDAVGRYGQQKRKPNDDSFGFLRTMDVEINELYAAARDKMETQGLFSREAYFEAIDEVLEEFQNDGLITDDDNTPEVREQLRRKWAEIDQDEDSGARDKLSEKDEDLIDQYLEEE